MNPLTLQIKSSHIRVVASFVWLVFSLAVFACALPAQAEDLSSAMLVVSPSPLPSLPTAAPEGSRIGSTKDATFLVGGLDANRAPSNAVLVLPAGASKWQQLPLKKSLAWTALAATNDALLCVGGIDAAGASTRVFRLSWEGDQLREEELPSLPTPRAGAGAAVLDDTLYVFGGVSSPDAKEALNSLVALDLRNPGRGWSTLPPLPGAGRVLPALVAQYGMVLIIGGREVAPGSDLFAPTREVWAYLPKALDGTMRTGWEVRAQLPVPTVDASAAPVGPDQVVVLPGVLQSSTPWALTCAASPDPSPALLFNTVTNAWVDSGASVPGTARGLILRASGNAFDVPAVSSSGGSLVLQVHRSVRTLEWLDYVVIAAYFLLLVYIGAYYSGKQNSSEEFSLGSRKVAWWAAGISMFATGASAISFMAIPALAFATSLIWTVPLLVYIPAYFIQAHLIFPLLRRMNLTSTYEYLERRFNLPLRLVASAQCIIMQTFGRASVVLVLPSLAISAVTGINIYASVVIMGIITTVYTALGGFEAVIWTSVFQGVLKFMAPLVMIFIAIFSLPGGFHEFWTEGLSEHKFDLVLPTWSPSYPVFWGMLLATLLAATVQMAGDQPIIQRVFSAPMHEVRRVAAMSAVCSIVIGVIVNVMGLAIFCYFHAYPGRFDPLASNDQIVPLYTIQALPMGMAGVVVAAIFASAMATVASSMNSVATLVTEDFYLRWRPRTPDKVRLWMLKSISYLVGFIATLVALLLASLNILSMMSLWTQAVSLLGGGIVGVYSLGMFTKRANGAGAIIGAVASIIITALVKLFTPIHWSLYSVVAVLSCMLIGYGASFFWPHDERSLTGLTVFTPSPTASSAVPREAPLPVS